MKVETRIVRKTRSEVTLRSIWGHENSDILRNPWESAIKFAIVRLHPIPSESRNWSNEELQVRAVHAKKDPP